MPLQFRKIDTASVTKLTAFANAMRPSANPVMRSLGAVFPIDRITQASLQHAFPVYSLGTADLHNPQFQLNTAKQTSWLYLVDHDLTASVGYNPVSNEHQFSSFDQGPLPEELAKRVQQVTADATMQAKNAEITLLHIPTLYIYALWIKNAPANSSADVLVIVLSDQRSIPAGKTYNVADFFKAINAIPQKNL